MKIPTPPTVITVEDVFNPMRMMNSLSTLNRMLYTPGGNSINNIIPESINVVRTRLFGFIDRKFAHNVLKQTACGVAVLLTRLMTVS